MHTAIPVQGLHSVGQKADMTLGQQQINKHMKNLMVTGSLLIFLQNDRGRPLWLLQANNVSNCWEKYWLALSILFGQHRLSSHTSAGNSMTRQDSLLENTRYLQHSWEKQKKKESGSVFFKKPLHKSISALTQGRAVQRDRLPGAFIPPQAGTPVD